MKFRTPVFFTAPFLPAALAIVAAPALFGQTSLPMAPGAHPPVAVAPMAPPADPNKIVLAIGNEKLTAAQFATLVEGLPPQYQSYAQTNKRQFAESIVQLKLLAQGAELAGLGKNPKVIGQLEFSRENLLAQAMFETIQQNAKVDEALVQMYYDAHKNEYESVKAKHILVRVKDAPMPGSDGKPELTEPQALAKAQDLVKRLKAGADFATLAKAESDDSGSSQAGGEMPEFHRGMMVPPFEEAAFAQKVGELGEPVKSPFGYHIIVVEAHKLRSFAEAKPDIEKVLRPEMAKKEVQALRDKAAVKIDDDFFGPAVAQPSAPAPPK